MYRDAASTAETIYALAARFLGVCLLPVRFLKRSADAAFRGRFAPASVCSKAPPQTSAVPLLFLQTFRAILQHRCKKRRCRLRLPLFGQRAPRPPTAQSSRADRSVSSRVSSFGNRAARWKEKRCLPSGSAESARPEPLGGHRQKRRRQFEQLKSAFVIRAFGQRQVAALAFRHARLRNFQIIGHRFKSAQRAAQRFPSRVKIVRLKRALGLFFTPSNQTANSAGRYGSEPMSAFPLGAF